MERGKLFFHYLDGEPITCEQESTGIAGLPTFKLCIAGEDERIEIRDVGPDELAALRDRINAALASVPVPEHTSDTAAS